MYQSKLRITAAGRPSWVVTCLQIHKAQGLSIDYLKVDLTKTGREAGMAYVALSRATSLEGLQILGHAPDSAWRDPRVHR
jgi:ATP-dependent DNA helicase PIF1